MPDYDYNLVRSEALKLSDPAIVICQDGSYRTRSWKNPRVVGRGRTRDLALEHFQQQLQVGAGAE